MKVIILFLIVINFTYAQPTDLNKICSVKPEDNRCNEWALKQMLKKDCSVVEKYMPKACELGNPSSCHLVGICYTGSNKKDSGQYRRGVELLTKCCKVSHKGCCQTLKDLK